MQGETAYNLKLICSVRTEDAKNPTLDRPSTQKLLIQVRRATGSDQLQLLKWSIAKYPVQGSKMLEK